MIKEKLRIVLGSPFPYGALIPAVLEAFEEGVGFSLPSDFRDYLLSYNGTQFVKNSYNLTGDIWDSVSIHHVFGLHDGPDYFQLQMHWQLYKYYGLHRWKHRLTNFVVFADTGNGDLLAINVKDGSIWFYEHDVQTRFLRMPGRFSKVESNFCSFVENLKAEEENHALLEGDPRFEDFKTRMAQLKAIRKLEAQSWKDGRDS